MNISKNCKILEHYCWKSQVKKSTWDLPAINFRKSRGTKLQDIILGKIRIGGIQQFNMSKKCKLLEKYCWKSQVKKIPGISSDNFHRARLWAGFFVANLNLFGLRGDFPYCKRFVLAGTKREPSKQSLWGKNVFNRATIKKHNSRCRIYYLSPQPDFPNQDVGGGPIV